MRKKLKVFGTFGLIWSVSSRYTGNRMYEIGIIRSMANAILYSLLWHIGYTIEIDSGWHFCYAPWFKAEQIAQNRWSIPVVWHKSNYAKHVNRLLKPILWS